MGTTSEELKKLYKKLGGKDPKVAGFSAPGEILNAINEIPLPTEYELPTVTTEDAGDVLVVNEEGKWDKGEAGGGLPEVTTDDNGDILQVVEGAWAKAALSDNVVVLQAGYESGYISIQGVTTNQIETYLNNGKFVVVAYGNNRYWFSGNTMYMYGMQRINGKIDISYYEWQRSPAKYQKVEGYAYPMAYNEINGKVLTVKNGQWSAENPPTPTHAYTTTEKVVGTWTDGKPVYEVSILVPSPTFAVWANVHYSANVARVISLDGVYDYAYASCPLGYNVQNELEFKAKYWKNSGDLAYLCSHSYDGANLTFTLRYTKTTD